MKYVESILPYHNKETIFFGRAGRELEGEEQHKQPHFAKIIKNTDTENCAYFIRTYQGTLFDPQGPYGRRERAVARDCKTKKVSKNTFDFYVTYLKTNNNVYLTKAQRGFLND
tara:strand:- start:293 stop:631 length:339 start_codon:yes stop_codon:yes gene_type:complete